MSAIEQGGPRLALSVRILCALTAVLFLLNMWQWSHSSNIQVAYGLAGALAWGSLGYYGNRRNWSRYVTAVLFVAFAALAVRRLAGAWV